VRVATDGMTAAELLEALAREERSMAAGGVEIVEKWKRKREDSRRGTWSCQWVGDGDGWWSAQGVVRENEVAAARQDNNHDMMFIRVSHPTSSVGAYLTSNAANTGDGAWFK
jgi:phage/plasmid primase-like uncharacterized protein